MSRNYKSKPRRTLTFPLLEEAYQDFILSRQVKNCTPATMEFYRYTAGMFLFWCEDHDIGKPDGINSQTVRKYMGELISRGSKDTTMHDHARAIKTMLRFFHKEEYMSRSVEFDMPKLAKKRLPILDIEQIREVLKVCNTRDRAIIIFMADTGLRRAEVCALNWGDVNMNTGLIRVIQGKGRKDRAAVCGAASRRALIKYRRTIQFTEHTPLFLSRTGERFTGDGLQLVFRRIRIETGIHITPHSLRRTFVILSLEAGMDALFIQGLLGQSSTDMVFHYAQMKDSNLLQAHLKYSPMERL